MIADNPLFFRFGFYFDRQAAFQAGYGVYLY